MAKGSVVKRSGTYYAVYRDGTRQVWERAGNSKKMADMILSKRMNEVNTGCFVEPKQTRFSEFAQKWLDDYAKINVRPITFISYEGIIRLHLNPDLGHKWLEKVTAGDIQQIISRKISKEGLSPKTAINIIVVIKEMLDHAVAWGYLYRNPARNVKRPRVEEKEMDFMTPEEIRLFLRNVSEEYHAFFLTAILTGMRRGEIVGLKWTDINWNSSEIVVRRALYKGEFSNPKTRHANRRILMSPMLHHAMEQHRLLGRRSEHNLIFCNREGNPIDANNMVKREFYPALERAGIRRIRFHDLRHTYASLLIAQGENIKFIQSQLGHSSAKTTLDRYGHLMPNLENNAAKRLDKNVFGEDFVRKLLENRPFVDSNSHFNSSKAMSYGSFIGSGGRI